MKEYKQVFALGVCLSSILFMKAQVTYKQKSSKNLFKKIIADGTWLSLDHEIENVTRMFLDRPYATWLSRYPSLISLGRTLFELLTHIRLKGRTLNTLDYLTQIDIPISFFQWKYDPQAPMDEFKEMWTLSPHIAQKITFVTPHGHIKTHLKQKELYKFLSNLFLDLPYGIFVRYLRDIPKLCNHLAQDYETKLQKAATQPNKN